MPKIIFLVDIANSNNVIKEHDGDIPAGHDVDFAEIPDNVQHLIDIGVAAAAQEDPPAELNDMLPDLLDRPAADAIKAITSELTQDELQFLLATESSNKDRKTVKEHILSLIAE